MGGGEHRSLNQQPSGFTPILGFRKFETLKKKFKAFTLAEVLIPKRTNEIKNKVFNFRESKIKEPLRNTKKLCAFTLAEVLITLAIIGVVAALTIPTVVAKYQKKQLYTQFMKTYNTLSNAISMAVAENGEYDTWGAIRDEGKDDDNEEEILEKNLLPYLKVAKKIDKSDPEYNYNVSLMNGESTEEDYGEVKNMTVGWGYDTTFMLSDGSIISFNLDDDDITFTFDTNGVKGPNVYGRDLFMEGLSYDKVDGKYVLIAPNMKKCTYDSKCTFRPKEELEEMFLSDSEEDNCTPEKKGGWFGCSARLLLEGKMNY